MNETVSHVIPFPSLPLPFERTFFWTSRIVSATFVTPCILTTTIPHPLARSTSYPLPSPRSGNAFDPFRGLRVYTTLRSLFVCFISVLIAKANEVERLNCDPYKCDL